jgi:hypothetical protein
MARKTVGVLLAYDLVDATQGDEARRALGELGFETDFGGHGLPETTCFGWLSRDESITAKALLAEIRSETLGIDYRSISLVIVHDAACQGEPSSGRLQELSSIYTYLSMGDEPPDTRREARYSYCRN